jgi:hypothetical protein
MEKNTGMIRRVAANTGSVEASKSAHKDNISEHLTERRLPQDGHSDLVVGPPFHDLLEVARCCSHEICDLLGALLDGRTRKLVGRGYDLRDTPLGFFVEGLVAPGHLVRGGLIRRALRYLRGTWRGPVAAG